MVKLDTADDVLQWAHSVCHPVKGTVKSGPNYDDVAAYLAYCVRDFEGLDDNHRTLFKQGCADASYIAECVRLRRAFEDLTAPREPSMYRPTESQTNMIAWLRDAMKGGGDE